MAKERILLTTERVAKILSVDEWTVRKYFRDDYISGAFKLNFEWRIEDIDLYKWIDSLKKLK